MCLQLAVAPFPAGHLQQAVTTSLMIVFLDNPEVSTEAVTTKFSLLLS